MTGNFHIAGRPVGNGAPTYVIAEVAQAHDGSLGTAHAYVDLVADIGANAVKFQIHFADAESTLDEPFRVKFSREDETRFDYWRRMEFSNEQWSGLADHAKGRGIDFLASVFSDQAFELADRLNFVAWKVASGEVYSEHMLEKMARTGRPLIISTGMSAWEDIDHTVAHVRRFDANMAILQCTSMYPTPMDAVGLNVMDELQARYGVPVGLSDHSASIWPPIAAIARGASVLEMHVVFDRRAFGPDALASLTAEEFASVIAARDEIQKLRDHPVDKNEMANQLSGTLGLFSRSLAPATDLKAGTVIERHHLTAKKPGSGIPPTELDEMVGRRLKHDVDHRRLLRPEDIE